MNLLIGTENGLMLLDRSGQGKVYQLISRRRFQQMEVSESGGDSRGAEGSESAIQLLRARGCVQGAGVTM